MKNLDALFFMLAPFMKLFGFSTPFFHPHSTTFGNDQQNSCFRSKSLLTGKKSICMNHWSNLKTLKNWEVL